MWYGERQSLSPGDLVSDPPSPCMGSIPHLIYQSTINYQRDNLLNQCVFSITGLFLLREKSFRQVAPGFIRS